ncbi:MAG: type II toxin-antitoxin system RelE/ParE family toxin [Planctomycetaceae bacterium]|nr:type II toxin-antitoxin system RelE/ParE family toxin [Planctomycetaceae bacterium]
MSGTARMPEYRLTPDAADDLAAIARYTVTTWNHEQAARYGAALEQSFRAIATGAARQTTPLPRRPDVRCHRCQHHYVFSIHEERGPVTVVAILHESMDLPTRLRARLNREEPKN